MTNFYHNSRNFIVYILIIFLIACGNVKSTGPNIQQNQIGKVSSYQRDRISLETDQLYDVENAQFEKLSFDSDQGNLKTNRSENFYELKARPGLKVNDSENIESVFSEIDFASCKDIKRFKDSNLIILCKNELYNLIISPDRKVVIKANKYNLNKSISL